MDQKQLRTHSTSKHFFWTSAASTGTNCMVLIVNEDSSRVHDSIGLYKTRPNFPELLFRQVGYVKVTLSRWPSKSLTIHQTYGVKIMRRNIVSYDNFDSWGEHLPGFRLVDSVARLRFLDCNFINLTVEPSGFKYRTTFDHFWAASRTVTCRQMRVSIELAFPIIALPHDYWDVLRVLDWTGLVRCMASSCSEVPKVFPK